MINNLFILNEIFINNYKAKVLKQHKNIIIKCKKLDDFYLEI